MKYRLRMSIPAVALSLPLTLAAALTGAASATPAGDARAARAAATVSAMAVSAPTLTSSAVEVEPDESYTLTATVPRKKKVSLVALQYRDSGKWIASTKINGVNRSTYLFGFNNTLADVGVRSYRVIVRWRDAPKQASNIVTVTRWNWVRASEVAYEATDTWANPYEDFTINGDEYTGLGSSWAGNPEWDLTFSLGGQCKAFAGLAGVDDDSAPGSKAKFVFSTPDEEIRAVGGVTVGNPSEVWIPLPADTFRFTVDAISVTSPDADPNMVVGRPWFLCKSGHFG